MKSINSIPGRKLFGQQGSYKRGHKNQESPEARAELDGTLASIAPTPSPWRERAACAEHNAGEDLTYLFLPDEQGNMDPELMEQAAAICATCPVHTECGEWLRAQGNLMYTQGVWDGVDVAPLHNERRRKARR